MTAFDSLDLPKKLKRKKESIHQESQDLPEKLYDQILNALARLKDEGYHITQQDSTILFLLKTGKFEQIG